MTKKEALESISREEFSDYYLNNTKKECMEHFCINEYIFKFLYAEYCVKEKNAHFKMYDYDSFTKDCVEDYYKSHNIEDTMRFLNVKNEYGLYLILKHFGIKKKCIENRESLKTKISYADLYDAYIIKGLSKRQLVDYFNCRYSDIGYLMKSYNICKSNEQIQQNKCEHNLDKYGRTQSIGDGTFKKRNNTIIEKYGSVEEYNKQRLEKSKTTSKERYGKEFYTQTDEFKEEYKNTCLQKYGYESYLSSKIDNQSPLYRELWRDREKCIDFLSSFDSKLTIKEFSEILGTNCGNLLAHHHIRDMMILNGSSSSYESDIILFIGESLCNIHNRKLLNNDKEIDIYIPDKKFAIEVNGHYWHSNLFKDKYYHFNKSRCLYDSKIKLIHIWDYEWDNDVKRNILKSLINKNIDRDISHIQVSSCMFKKISNEEAYTFNTVNSLYEYKESDIIYGAFYNNELCQIIGFTNIADSEWNISINCSRLDICIDNSEKEILSQFISEYNPNKITVVCDFSKSDGLEYKDSGMMFNGFTEPNPKYVYGNLIVDRIIDNNTPSMVLYDAGGISFIWIKN